MRKRLDYDLNSYIEEYTKKGCSIEALETARQYIQKKKLSEFDTERYLNNVLRAISLNEIITKYTPPYSATYTPKKSMDAVWGALYGDIVGSRYEFAGQVDDNLARLTTWRNIRGNLRDGYRLTDDSVMTMATAHALLTKKRKKKEKLTSKITPRTISEFETLRGRMIKQYEENYKKWGRAYPDAGYGGYFFEWLSNDNNEPYGSFGNGSAMRISPIAAFGMSCEDTLKNTIASAACSHDHIEGVRGACVEAMCIWLAATCKDKETVFNYMRNVYSMPGWNLFEKFSMEEAMSIRAMQVSCMFSVPAAVLAFHESESFDEAIAKALVVGLDTDTNTSLAGAIAGAMYGVEPGLKQFVLSYCADTQKRLLEKLEKQLCGTA